jgi:hypothetical protein
MGYEDGQIDERWQVGPASQDRSARLSQSALRIPRLFRMRFASCLLLRLCKNQSAEDFCQFTADATFGAIANTAQAGSGLSRISRAPSRPALEKGESRRSASTAQHFQPDRWTTRWQLAKVPPVA